MTSPTAQHLALARARWNLLGDIDFIRHVENHVYVATHATGPVVLRLTDPSHRGVDALTAELDWVAALADAGVSVAAPVPSVLGSHVERLDDGASVFHAAVLRRAPGGPLRTPAAFTADVMRAWGELLGRMHAHTRRWTPQPDAPRRAAWRDDVGLALALHSVDAARDPVSAAFVERLRTLDAYDRSPDAYGLVHADLHHGNFFAHEGTLTAFDFDDSCYHWYAYDLATALLGLDTYLAERGAPEQMPRCRAQLLDGYARAHALPPPWIDRVDAFMAYRAGLLYHWVRTRIADGEFDDAALAWSERALPRFAARATGDGRRHV